MAYLLFMIAFSSLTTFNEGTVGAYLFFVLAIVCFFLFIDHRIDFRKGLTEDNWF